LESKGTFVTVKPKNALVSRYIAYYYFHHSDEASFKRNFFFYPNYNHALTVYKGSDVSLTEVGSVILPSAEDNISTFYSINIGKNFKVSLNGAFDKIGVVFNPLGINHFISCSLNETLGNAIFSFDHFGEAFDTVLRNVYDEHDPERKAVLLDTFFAENYKGFNELVIKAAVSEILNSNGSVRVEELSEKLQVNRKTLLRLFKKHLCCSVEEYKKLVMFRNALNYSQQHKDEASLTDVALYNLYYDQAHFIKHFKSVTKLPPKTLLSNLTHLGSQGVVYWHFED
jgi:AraC-like DNA-binding protein